MTTKLERFTLMALEEPQTRFTSLMGLLFDPAGLSASFGRQDGHKAPGVDGAIGAIGDRSNRGQQSGTDHVFRKPNRKAIGDRPRFQKAE